MPVCSYDSHGLGKRTDRVAGWTELGLHWEAFLGSAVCGGPYSWSFPLPPWLQRRRLAVRAVDSAATDGEHHGEDLGGAVPDPALVKSPSARL